MERAPLAILVATDDPADPGVARLLESLAAFNVDELPVHVVTPASLGLTSVAEVPLAFWETGLCDHYWALDAATILLRPLTSVDLMADRGRPYAFLSEEADRAVDPLTASAWRNERAGVERIREEVRLTDPRVRSNRHSTLYSSAVAASFRDEFLVPRGMTYADALAVVPDASGWYCGWVQAAHPDAYVAREPIVLDLDSENRYLQMSLRQQTSAALARSYAAIRVVPPHTMSDAAPGARTPRERLVAEHAGPGELLRAAWLRVYRQLPSLQRLVARVRRS